MPSFIPDSGPLSPTTRDGVGHEGERRHGEQHRRRHDVVGRPVLGAGVEDGGDAGDQRAEHDEQAVTAYASTRGRLHAAGERRHGDDDRGDEEGDGRHGEDARTMSTTRMPPSTYATASTGRAATISSTR